MRKVVPHSKLTHMIISCTLLCHTRFSLEDSESASLDKFIRNLDPLNCSKKSHTMDYPPRASQPLNEYNSAFLASMAFPILAVIALVNRGRVKWTDKTVSIFQLFLNFLKQIEAFRDDYAFTCSYISTKSNPADALSRRALGSTAQSTVPDEPMNQ